jgi:hypothetical protein
VSVEAFLKSSWHEHGDQPGDVAELLASSTHLLEAAEQVAPYAHLVTHVYGEHLGQWEDGVELLESLQQLPLAHVAAGTRALAVGIATLRYAGGNNLAVSLEGRSPRSAYETQGMLMAAEGALQYWKQAGTWLEEERAEYRLARSRLQAGETAAAVQSAGCESDRKELEG